MPKRRRKRVVVRPTSPIYGKVPDKAWRPQTRADCLHLPRPCPYYSCRYHLALDIQPSGNVVLPFGDDPAALARMKHTCALDVADLGPQRNIELSELMGISRQRVNQLEHAANIKLRRAIGAGCQSTADLLDDLMR